MKKKKLALLQSVVSLVLCLSMFVSTTFAWFTDVEVSGGNIIASGTLDATMEYATDPNGEWTDASTGTIFSYEYWEPGYTDMKFIRIGNKGSLAFRYQLHIIPTEAIPEGEPSLADVIDVYYCEVTDGFTMPADFSENMPGMTKVGTLSDLIGKADGAASGVLLPESGSDNVLLNPADEPIARTGSSTLCILLHMQETAGNEYQNLSVGGTFRVQLNATQYTWENDSFGNDYDVDSQFPIPDNDISENVSADVTVENNQVKDGVTIQGTNATAQVPSGVQVSEGTDKLTLTITEKEASESNITLGENEAMRALDVHVEGVAEGNTQPMEIYIKGAAPKGLNAGNLKLYHVENGVSNAMTPVDTFTAHNQFKYDPATGDVTLYMATFSEVTCVVDTLNPWQGSVAAGFAGGTGTEKDPYIIANADQLVYFGKVVGGMDGNDRKDFDKEFVKLISDINLGDKESENKSSLIFHPIGYYYNGDSSAPSSTVYSFKGTFDGAGHTIANFYQNTWEIKGDYDANYYKDAMGLFGYVNGGTVKNLTVANFSSDGEFTPTGVIAAYAAGDATFENIAIVNCNPRVYNTGNGGIIGIAGDTSAADDDHITLKNITVDNSNKISALWGSWDVACGGLVGMYRGNVDDSGNATGDTISFTNCHVAAQIDVYNDVCANYQYYAYRYAGMIIGSVRHNTTNGDGKTIPNMTGISASGCTVNYGDWNDYYYCELVANSIASYTHDYQFSRLTKVDTLPDSASGTAHYYVENSDGTITCRHFIDGERHEHSASGTETVNDETVAVEDKTCVYLPFDQMFTGYSWGVDSQSIDELAGIENLGGGITEGDQQESVEKFTIVPALNASVVSAEDCEVSIGELFEAITGASINSSAVQVAVTALNDSGITAEYVASTTGNWEDGTLTFNKTAGLCAVTIQDYNFCKPTTIYLEDGKRVELEKFAIVFPNVDKYLYRVGNQNAVSLSSLFKETEIEPADDKVEVTVANITGTASGTHTPNATWENGTLKFSGTGLVTVTISEAGGYATTLNLEVVDAWNTTTVTNATERNVVLLNDCEFSSLEVSGGYTLYGNGFTMTCGSDSVALDMGYGFVTLNHGTLDNVQIVCPNFDYSVLYASNRTDSGNYKETDNSGKTRYGNVKSAVIASGNSRIVDSRISGGRAAVYATNGNIVLDNTRVELGAAANIHVGAAVTGLILKNVTLVQKPTQANVRDSSNTIMGLSVIAMADSNGNAAPITIEGELNQYAWAHEGYVEYVPEKGQDMVDDVLSQQDYIHSITYEDGVARDSVNLGIVFMPDETTANEPTITDSRANHPYSLIQVGVVGMKAWIYTVGNSNITDNQGSATDMDNVPGYEPNKQGEMLPVLEYSDVNEDRVFTSIYDVEKGWIYKLTVNLDNGAYTFDFSNLTMKQAGNAVTYSRPDGVSSSIDVSEGTVEYELTANIEGVAYKVYFQLIGTASSKEAPQWSNDQNGTSLSTTMNASFASGVCVAVSYGGKFSGAAPALTNVYVRYYSTEAKDYRVIHLADYTPTTKGTFDGTDTTCTIQGPDFTLTLTGGQVHSSNKINAMPVVIQSDSTYTLYFVASSDSGLVNSGNTARTVPVTYTFTDNLGNTLTGSHTWSVAEDKSNEYKYSDFCNGTMTQLKDSSCLAAGTMITLADGTKRAVENLRKGDMVMSYDHVNGVMTSNKVIIVVKTESDSYYKNTFVFDDGSELVTINEHGIYNWDLRKYVNIDHLNAEEFIGHRFVAVDTNGKISLKKLVAVDTVVESGYKYDIVTDQTLNYVAEDTLSVTHVLVDVINSFDFNGYMRYDQKKMQADIEKYGLYTYDEWEEYCDISVFEQYNIPVMKVGISKGLYTQEYIIGLINTYVLDESVQIID